MKLVSWIVLTAIAIASIFVIADQMRKARGPLNPPVENPIYSRSDCTVKVVVDFPDSINEERKREIAGDVGESFQSTIMDKWHPVASHGLGRNDVGAHYIIFTQKCNKKYDMVQDMIDDYTNEYPDGGRLTISHEIVPPHIDTMAIQGPDWTDGFEDIGRGKH